MQMDGHDPGARRIAAPEQTLQQRILSVGIGWQTAQYMLVTLVAELDAHGGWEGPGTPTCAHWVADALDIELATAREWLRVGRALRELPRIGAAFEAGLSYSKVRTLTRVATAENERELLDLAWATPAARLGIAIARWLSDRETPEETARRQHAARGVSWHTDPDGMIVGEFRLAPVHGKRLTTAIDAVAGRSAPHRSGDASADASVREPLVWPSVAQQRADALVQLLDAGGTRFLTEVVIHLRGSGVEYDDGTPIPWVELESILPEAFVRALVYDAESRPVDASSRRRHPSVRQQRIVAARDRCCVDCGSTEFLEYDHDPEYRLSGRTVVDELYYRCRDCHRARHRDSAA